MQTMTIIILMLIGAALGLAVGGWHVGRKASDGDYSFLALWLAGAILALVAAVLCLIKWLS